MSKSTKYFDLYSALKAGGDKGVSPESLMKATGFNQGALAVYIHALRHKFGAVIESVRNGRNIVAYRLTNADEVKITSARKPRTVKPKPTVAGYQKAKAKKAKSTLRTATKTVKSKAPVRTAAVDDGSVPVLDTDMDITEYTDRDLEDIKDQLGIA